jgi:predicted nucleic acid-binding protein
MPALYRRHAVGDLTEHDLIAVVSRIEQDRRHWELIEVSPQVLARAEEVIQATGVRTLDAVHVAPALAFQAASAMRIPFFTGDARQREGAARFALEVVWVG